MSAVLHRESSVRRRAAWAAAPWLAAAAVIAFLAVGAVYIAVPPSKTGERRAWIPTAAGTTAVFRARMDGKEVGRHTSITVGPALLAGVDGVPRAVTTSEHYDNYRGQGVPLDAVAYQGWKGDKLVGYGFRYRGTYYETKPGQQLIDVPPKAGQTWTWKGEAGGSPTTAATTLVRFESVHALGRTLESCPYYRTRQVSKSDSGESTVDSQESWVCYGLGIVKFRSTSGGHVYEETLERFGSPETPSVPTRGHGEQAGEETHETAPAAPPGASPGIDPGRSQSVRNAAAPAERPAWTIDLRDTSRTVPVGNATVTVTGDSHGNVTVFDRETGNVRWRVTLPGPLLVSPTIAARTLLVADGAKHFGAYDLASGELRWTVKLPDLVGAEPAVRGDTVVLVSEDRAVRALSLEDGHALWTEHVPALATKPPALVGEAVVVGVGEGELAAFSFEHGHELWGRKLHSLLSAGPAAANGLVVAADEEGNVYGYDAEDGKLRWNRYVGSTVELAPAIAGDRVLVVAGEHRLKALAASDGRTLWSKRFRHPLGAGPVVLGDHVIALGEEGELFQLSLASGEEERELEVPRPSELARTEALRAMNYFGGALVVTLSSELPFAATNVVAFPAARDGEDAAPGVAFEEQLRRVVPPISISGPIAPPAAHEEHLYFPGWDRMVWDVPPRGRPVALAKDVFTLFAVPAGEVVLAQLDQDLAAIPREGGEPRWRYRIGAPSPGGAPAARGDLVYVPAESKGLVALSLESGHRVWAFADEGVIHSAPIVASGGNVVWAGPSGLVGLDGKTGRRLWSLGGLATFDRPAERDGVVVVQGNYGGSDRVIAVRADTGRLLWATGPVASGGGFAPVIGEDVAVVPGADAVAAYDLESGKKLWSAPIVSGLNGDPVIVGDAVAVAERGRIEDLQSQERAITVRDLRSGKLLGLLQLPGTGSGNTLATSFGSIGESEVVDYGSGVLYLVKVGAE